MEEWGDRKEGVEGRMTSMNLEPSPPERMLVIAAHPDDIEFVVAGTVAKWIQAGSEVRYVLATSGDAGTHQPGVRRQELARIREAEQRAAARVVGAEKVVAYARGRQGRGVAEGPAFIRITLGREGGAGLHPPDHHFDASAQLVQVLRLGPDDASHGKHEGDFAVEKHTPRRLLEPRPPAGIGHEEEIHPILPLQSESLVEDVVHDAQGLRRP